MSNSVLEEQQAVENKGIYWEEEKKPEDRGRAAYAAFKYVEDEQSVWRENTLDHVRMYRNIEMMGYYGRSAVTPVTMHRIPLSLNVVRNMANAVHSRITRNKIKCIYQCKGADWGAKERSRKLEAFGTGLALKGKLHKKTAQAFVDLLITGTGVMKTFAIKSRKEVLFERIFSPNLMVDFAEGADVTQTPAHYYEVKFPSKHTLIRRYPNMRAEIEALPTLTSGDGDPFYALQESDASDKVKIVESLFIDPDDPARGILSIVGEGGIELTGGEWTAGDPYSVMRWSTSNLGWYGMGLAEELKGIQSEINKLLRKIATAMGLLGNPYIFADRSSNIQKGNITDIPGSIILYNGKEPKINAPATVHPEMFQHLDRLYSRAYEIAGISQLSAHGEKPAGLESGRSLLVYDDIQDSDRFATVHEQWSELHVDCISKGVRAASLIPDYEVPIYGKSSYEVIRRKDLDLKDDDWVIHPMPASMLGDTPAGQIEMVDMLAKRGYIENKSDLLEEIATPDVAAYLKRHTSPKRLIEKIIGSMLQGGEYIPPASELNLALCLDTAQLMYLEAQLDGCPEENLQKVDDFMVQVTYLINKASAKSPPSIGAMPQPQSQVPQIPAQAGAMPGAPPPQLMQ
jgi:hypothetical protein